jgi:ABC-type glycerol-3-phosphate transport system permease component
MPSRKLAATIPGRIALVLWTILALAPFVLIVLLSFRSNTDIYKYPLGVGGSYHPENYAMTWTGTSLGVGMADYLRNTGIAAGVGLAVSLSIGATAAFFATKLTHKAQDLFIGVFLAAQAVPFVVIVVPYFQAYNALLLLSQPAAIGVAYGVLALPTVVLVMHSYFRDFPTEILEANAVDGLSEFRSYVMTVIPLSKAALIAAGMLVLIFIWGEAQLGVVLLQDANSQTVSVGMLGYQGTFVTNLGALFAGLSIAMVPLIIIYLIFQRFVTKGVALGGVSR